MSERLVSPEALIVSSYKKSAEEIARYARKFTGSDARFVITSIISRNAQFVFGRRLAERATAELREPNALAKDEYSVGEELINKRYAQIAGPIAVGFGWGEDTPAFQLLCGYIYEQSIQRRSQNVEIDVTKQMHLKIFMVI